MTPLVSTLAAAPGGSAPSSPTPAATAPRPETRLELTLAGRPPAGVHTGTLGRDAATGRVIFTATQLKLIVPPDAAGHLQLPVSAVVRIAPYRGDGPATARLTPVRTPADPAPSAPRGSPAPAPATPP
ncbi:MAG: hypothetical protein GVY33_14270, partial [Alphaproteobacteria bacterium]|nr:hypothetical protein [Alphaproteobacteria bacterium]